MRFIPVNLNLSKKLISRYILLLLNMINVVILTPLNLETKAI